MATPAGGVLCEPQGQGCLRLRSQGSQGRGWHSGCRVTESRGLGSWPVSTTSWSPRAGSGVLPSRVLEPFERSGGGPGLGVGWEEPGAKGLPASSPASPGLKWSPVRLCGGRDPKWGPCVSQR